MTCFSYEKAQTGTSAVTNSAFQKFITGTMKVTLAAVCTFCFVAASAYEIRRENSALETPMDAESKAVGTEAILIGQVLRYVARELEKDESLDKELDEYFFGELFGKIKDGVKKAVKVVGQVVKGVGKVVISPVKAVVDVVKDHLKFSMEENVMEKATKILTKLVDKSAASYSFHDNRKAEDIVKQVCARIDSAGLRLIEQGQQLLGLYDSDF